MVHGRFARWRKTYVGRRPIPEFLWAAAELAREHGVFQTAETLRLDYGQLGAFRRRLAYSLAEISL
jgi:hypothetical protein